jgi:adaptin ear-binding coat-associated protein 1/2
MVLIERILYVAPKIRVYVVPPVTSLSGYMAKDWGVEDERKVIFMGRLRVIESTEESEEEDDDDSGPKDVKIDVRIEDKDSGELFANCPYEVCSLK